jgi:hypothetical protein
MTESTRRDVLGWLCLTPFTLPILSRSAQAAGGGKVHIDVRVVHATNAHTRIDQRLEKIARHLRNLRYTGFDFLKSEDADLIKNGKRSFSIAGERKMTVNLLSKDTKRARLRVQIHGKRGKLLDTTVSIRRNGFFVVAGPKYKDGILVLPISVKY